MYIGAICILAQNMHFGAKFAFWSKICILEQSIHFGKKYEFYASFPTKYKV